MAFCEEAVVTADWMSLKGQEPPAPAGIDVSVPHSARIWNYWLGGKDNFAVDRAVGSPAQVAAFFDGLRLVEPGVVSCSLWRPDPQAGIEAPEVAVYGGVAVKP